MRRQMQQCKKMGPKPGGRGIDDVWDMTRTREAKKTLSSGKPMSDPDTVSDTHTTGRNKPSDRQEQSTILRIVKIYALAC